VVLRLAFSQTKEGIRVQRQNTVMRVRGVIEVPANPLCHSRETVAGVAVVHIEACYATSYLFPHGQSISVGIASVLIVLLQAAMTVVAVI
jgi:hypothetical protein